MSPSCFMYKQEVPFFKKIGPGNPRALLMSNILGSTIGHLTYMYLCHAGNQTSDLGYQHFPRE